MLILAFESSAKAASVALVRDGVLLGQAYQNSGLTHSRTLLPMAEDMLKNLELSLQDVDLLAVSRGPGSFTGIRIGVSTVKGLAWALEKPVCGVSTLEAMANLALSAGEGPLVCCAMDARRNQVYNALFEISGGRPRRLTADRPIAVAELAAELAAMGREAYLVGDGAELCYTTLLERLPRLTLLPEHLRQQRASGAALAAWEKIGRGERGDAGSLTPNYLRLSQAERARLEKTKTE